MNNNWRRFIIGGTLILAVAALMGGTAKYLEALPDAPAGSATTQEKGSPIPKILGIGEKQDSYYAGQDYMAIMNSELTDTYTGRGWRGSGRSMSPTMGYPSFTYPAGGLDAPLWASACGITAYLPDANTEQEAFKEGSFVGTFNVYRNPPQYNTKKPVGYWSDLGGMGSPGFGLGTPGPGGYREPFITEAEFETNVGIRVKRQSYSFSYGYGHTNDFILMRHVLKVHGNVDADVDKGLKTPNQENVTIKNFFMVLNYDFDIPWTNNPASAGGTIPSDSGGDDKTPPGIFSKIMPKAVPAGLINSGRYNQPPYSENFYSGVVAMFDEDASGRAGIDSYLWNATLGAFNPLHLGEASLMVLEGDGTGPLGDTNAEASLDIYDAPSVGLFQLHQWWIRDLIGVWDWYAGCATKFLQGARLADLSVSGDISAHSTFFTNGGELGLNEDISTWTAKTQPGGSAEGMGLMWGDPRNLSQPGNPGIAANVGLERGRYDHITLFDLSDNGKFKGIVPDFVQTGNSGDEKETTSAAGCIRQAIGWGPYTKEPGQHMTIWQADLAGAGHDGIYDVYLRAQDVWMQRKYNPANDTYYWDGSNERIIPMYKADGSVVKDANDVVMHEVVSLGRGVDSGALFHPPPPPTLSVFATNGGTIALGWLSNAERAIDPGTGTADFAKYRVYRASGFIDQFPSVLATHETGYNSNIIPPNMGLREGAPAIVDVLDPTSSAVKQSHPYARFIHEGFTIGADFNIGRVYDFVAKDLVNSFAAPNFAGPYVQIAEFSAGGGVNTFNPPESVTYPNPLDGEQRLPGFEDDAIETVPSSRQILENNDSKGANTAHSITFGDRYPDTIGSGDTGITTVGGIKTDPRLVGQSGYIFEDRSVLIGFSYWYYVAAVDNESATQYDFDNYVQDQNSSQQLVRRQIDGLESFYTMNANGTDGRWHGRYPYRGLTVGPQMPGQEVVPVSIERNAIVNGQAEFLDLITVAPNPFVLQAKWDLVTNTQSVKFFNIPVSNTRITIFDAAGLRVRQFAVPSAKTTTLGGVTSWDLKNDSNVPVASGLYICVVEAEIGGQNYAKTLKLYVRR